MSALLEQTRPPPDGAGYAGPAAAAFHPPLTERRDLTTSLWRFGRLHEGWLNHNVRFLPDGRVLGTGNSNEANWRLEDGFLFITSATGNDTTRFERWQIVDRRPAMTGPYLPDPCLQHVIAPNRDDLHSVRWLRHPSRPVLVIFNNAGAPFDGHDTRWSLYRLTEKNGFDYVRFAEGIDPLCWYLNKVSRILSILRELVAMGYREISFYGCSSGGYAAMLFAELLHAEFAELRLRTVCLNPQTLHGDTHEARIRENAPHPHLPAFILPDALSQSELPNTAIPELVAARIARGPDGSAGSIEHRILFDSGNYTEAYYAAALEGLPGFDLRPRPLALPHREGIDALMELEQPDALDWALAP